MHPEALAYCQAVGFQDRGVAVDLGGCDVNGTARECWPGMAWHVVDQRPGPGVTEVADITLWRPIAAYDLALCTEVLEHCQDWPMVLETAHFVLEVGGIFVVTCAGPGREPHSAIDGGPLRADEHYANVEPGQLETVLRAVGFDLVKVAYNDASKDTYATARRYA